MIYSCGESELRRFEGIVGWEVNIEEEDTPLEGTVSGPEDGGLPVKRIIS